MNVSIKQFYPTFISDEEIKGSLHISVTIETLKFDIRGIFLRRRSENKFFIRMPIGRGMDPTNGENTTFPILTFSKEIGQELLNLLYQSAPSFFDTFMVMYQPSKRFLDGVNTKRATIVKGESEHLFQQSTKEDKELSKKETTAPHDKKIERVVTPTQKPVSEREWIDPPKRKLSKATV